MNCCATFSCEALNEDLPSTLTVHQVAETIDRPMIVQLTLIWRPENIFCNMASGSLIGLSIFDLGILGWEKNLVSAT